MHKSKSHENKKNMECRDFHKKGYFERDFLTPKSQEKASASIVEQVCEFDNEYILTTSYDSGVYGNKRI